MGRVRAADDFKVIRVRPEELRRERAERYAGAPEANAPAPRSDRPAQQPSSAVRRILAETRRSSSR
jgi:hypothetical protein